jgi:hypothetical protein
MLQSALKTGPRDRRECRRRNALRCQTFERLVGQCCGTMNFWNQKVQKELLWCSVALRLVAELVGFVEMLVAVLVGLPFLVMVTFDAIVAEPFVSFLEGSHASLAALAGFVVVSWLARLGTAAALAAEIEHIRFVPEVIASGLVGIRSASEAVETVVASGLVGIHVDLEADRKGLSLGLEWEWEAVLAASYMAGELKSSG